MTDLLISVCTLAAVVAGGVSIRQLNAAQKARETFDMPGMIRSCIRSLLWLNAAVVALVWIEILR